MFHKIPVVKYREIFYSVFMDQNKIEQLMNFGLSKLESSAYLALLQDPGITGYRLSHILNKPTANVYKAVKSLELKGLAGTDKSARVRLFFPVPIKEYLKQQEISFRLKGEELQDCLQRITPREGASRTYKLNSFDQALSKAISIIENAESVIMIIAFKEVLDSLYPHLEKKAGGKTDIIIYTYSDYEIPGCRVIVSPYDSAIWKRIPERAFDISADGKVFMISNFKDDYSGLIEALYGNHVYLSLMIFNSMSKSILMHELNEEDSFSPRTRQELDSFMRARAPYMMANLPGVRNFYKRHGINPDDRPCAP